MVQALQTFILNDTHSAQLSIDFRTGRRTAIHAVHSCAEQRSACSALNRIRARGILEATQLAASREPLSLDDRFAAIAGLSRDRDVPLISLDLLGIHHAHRQTTLGLLARRLRSGSENRRLRDLRNHPRVYRLGLATHRRGDVVRELRVAGRRSPRAKHHARSG